LPSQIKTSSFPRKRESTRTFKVRRDILAALDPRFRGNDDVIYPPRRFPAGRDWRKIRFMKRAASLVCLLGGLLAFPAPSTVWAGSMVIAPPTINIQPGNPVLDRKCVDKLKGSGASTARAAHECRKASSPGTPPPLAAREHAVTDTPAPAAKP
jgi:hypothetical protein